MKFVDGGYYWVSRRGRDKYRIAIYCAETDTFWLDEIYFATVILDVDEKQILR